MGLQRGGRGLPRRVTMSLGILGFPTRIENMVVRPAETGPLWPAMDANPSKDGFFLRWDDGTGNVLGEWDPSETHFCHDGEQAHGSQDWPLTNSVDSAYFVLLAPRALRFRQVRLHNLTSGWLSTRMPHVATLYGSNNPGPTADQQEFIASLGSVLSGQDTGWVNISPAKDYRYWRLHLQGNGVDTSAQSLQYWDMR